MLRPDRCSLLPRLSPLPRSRTTLVTTVAGESCERMNIDPSTSRSRATVDSPRRPRVIAHRGASSVAPENTLLAFRLAIEAGAEMIETDAHLTRDGIVSLIHDDDLRRTTNCRGNISSMKSSALAVCDAGYWFVPQGERRHPYRGIGLTIPTITDLLDLVESMDTNVELNIEIKRLDEEFEVYRSIRLAELLITLVSGRDMTGQVLLSSFDRGAIDHVKSVAPTIRTAYICGPHGDIHAQIAYARARRHSAIHPHHSALGTGDGARRIVDVVHGSGLDINVWTVNEPQRMQELTSAGVDGIITDDPGLLRAVLEQQAAGSDSH